MLTRFIKIQLILFTILTVIALVVLQVLSSGLNLLGANQHLSTAVWGLFLIAVMVLRWGAGRYRQRKPGKG